MQIVNPIKKFYNLFVLKNLFLMPITPGIVNTITPQVNAPTTDKY